MNAGFAWHSVLIDRPEGARDPYYSRGCDVCTHAFSYFSAAEPSLQVPCLLVVFFFIF